MTSAGPAPAAGGGDHGARARGTAALVLAGVLFGVTFLVMQRAVDEAEPLPFLGARFLIAAAVLAPFARRRPEGVGRARRAAEVRLGVVAGVLLTVAYVTQTVGLQSTPSSTSAFITYLLVVIVPLMVAVEQRRLPERRVVTGVVLAVLGLYLLSEGSSGGFGVGELLTLGAAFGFAAHLMAVGRGAGRFDAVRFTFVQVLTVAVLCAGPGLFLGGYRFGASAWAAAAFTGVFATAVAFFCMVRGQRDVPEARAALILLVEPVSAGILGVATGESLGWRGAAGVALILGAIALVELVPLLRGEVVDDPAVEPTVHG